MSKYVTQKQLHKLLFILSIVLTLVIVLASVAAYSGKRFADNQIKRQLIQEKINFPPAGSKALDPKEYPTLQKYAGQQVDTGEKAKAYADEFIWKHLMKMSNGKTYAEISSESMANPEDKKLAELKNTMFMGNMLRSSLLTAYAFSIFGSIAAVALPITLLLVIASLGLTIFIYLRYKNIKD